MKKPISLIALLTRLFFIPVFLGLLLLIGFDFFQDLKRLNDSLTAQAQRIANVMAVTASQTPFPEALMAEQVSVYMQDSEALASVNFYPLSRPAPEVKPPKIRGIFLDEFLTRSAPVVVKNMSESNGMIGYISVTIDMQKARLGVIRGLTVKLLFMLVLFFFMSGIAILISRGRITAFKRLTEVGQKITQGELEEVYFVEHERSRTKEMRMFEDALVVLSGKLQVAKETISQLGSRNRSLNLKEQARFFQQSTFQSMITHELRTPLNAISGGLQLMDTQVLGQTNIDSVNLIKKGHERLSVLLDGIIELNNLQQGKININEVSFNPEHVLKEVAAKYANDSLKKGINLWVNIRHTETELNGDKAKIISILNHLTENAVKFTKEGGVTLTSQIHHLSDSQLVRWVCEVVDTGVGIEESIQKDIFNAYVQVDTGHNREHEGSGLGLTLAQKTANLMSGKITVTSEPNKGSTFRLILELPESNQIMSSQPLAGKKIMHLHTGKTSAFVDALISVGAAAVGYTQPNLALAAALEDNYDVITLCTHLAPEEVVSFAEQLRSQEEAFRSLLVRFESDDEYALASTYHLAGVDYWPTFVSITKFVNQLDTWLD